MQLTTGIHFFLGSPRLTQGSVSQAQNRACLNRHLKQCYAYIGRSLDCFAPLSLILILLVAALPGTGNADTRIELKCKIIEFSMDEHSNAKQIVEQFHIEDSTTDDGWGIITSEMTSNGKKLTPSLIDLTSEHVVLAHAVKAGEGYSRRLLAFTYLIDLRALEVTRFVVSLPGEINQRVVGKCEALGDGA